MKFLETKHQNFGKLALYPTLHFVDTLSISLKTCGKTITTTTRESAKAKNKLLGLDSRLCHERRPRLW